MSCDAKVAATEMAAPAMDNVLTAVALVCSRSQAPGAEAVTALPHVVATINSLLISSTALASWTLERAAECGFVHLLDRLHGDEWRWVGRPFRHLRRQSAVESAVSDGLVDVLQWWMTKYLSPDEAHDQEEELVAKIIMLAGLYSRLEVLQWLETQPDLLALLPVGHRIALTCKSPVIAEWLFHHLTHAQQQVSLVFELNHSALRDDFAMLKWLQMHPDVAFKVTGCMADFAALGGHLDALRWLHAHDWERCSSKVLNRVVKNDQVHVARWLYEHYPEGYFEELHDACRYLPTVQWALQEYGWNCERKRIAWMEQTVEWAAYWHDRSDVLDFILSIRPDVNCGDAMDIAAERGDLALVQRLHALHATATTEAMDSAAAMGHLDIVQWLHEHRSEGCTTKAMNYAAASNHLDVVQWLHANRTEGCTAEAANGAASHGHLEMIQWLHAHIPECFTAQAMDRAAAFDHLDVIQWLHLYRTEGCTTRAMDTAASKGHFEIVQWLYQYRSEGCTAEAVNSAARHDHLQIVQWFHQNLPQLCTQSALDQAASSGHLAIVQYLTVHCNLKWDPEAFPQLIAKKQFGTVEWLMKRWNYGRDQAVGSSGDYTAATTSVEVSKPPRSSCSVQ